MDKQHISFESLTAIAEDGATEGERIALVSHIRECAECRKRAEQVGAVLSGMRAYSLEEVPAPMLERAYGLFQSEPAGESRPGALRRIVAALVEQASPLTPAIGLRSDSGEETESYWFEADGNEVDLRVIKSGGRIRVFGQIFGDFKGSEALLSGADEGLTSEISDLSEFLFEDVPSGRYDLYLRSEDTEILIDGIVITEEHE